MARITDVDQHDAKDDRENNPTVDHGRYGTVRLADPGRSAIGPVSTYFRRRLYVL